MLGLDFKSSQRLQLHPSQTCSPRQKCVDVYQEEFHCGCQSSEVMEAARQGKARQDFICARGEGHSEGDKCC